MLLKVPAHGVQSLHDLRAIYVRAGGSCGREHRSLGVPARRAGAPLPSLRVGGGGEGAPRERRPAAVAYWQPSFEEMATSSMFQPPPLMMPVESTAWHQRTRVVALL